MNWYKENKDVWKEIIETVAAEKHRSTQMVEKDTIQSMFLQRLSKSELPFVFTGGTSLSKAYGLIDRFSEDIDLSMSRKPTESEKRKTKSMPKQSITKKQQKPRKKKLKISVMLTKISNCHNFQTHRILQSSVH